MNTVRMFIFLLGTASLLTGCASLTGKSDDYTSSSVPLTAAEMASATPPETATAGSSAPSALPEQSKVYESEAVKSDPSLKAGTNSKGWSVPAEPSPTEATRNSTPVLQPSNAQPDLGIVKSDNPTGGESITGGEVSGMLESAQAGLEQSGSSLRNLSGDPFAPESPASNGITLKSTFPELSSAQLNTSQPPMEAPALPPTASVAGTVRGGQAAPVFTATTMDGSSFDLSSQKGKVVVLDFWRKTCGPCLKAMPRMEQIRSSFPETKLAILGMNADETRTEAEGFLRTHPHNWPNVHVLSQRTDILSPYGVRMLPVFVVIDQVGNMQYRGNDVNQAAAKVAELVATPSIPNASYMAALR